MIKRGLREPWAWPKKLYELKRMGYYFSGLIFKNTEGKGQSWRDFGRKNLNFPPVSDFGVTGRIVSEKAETQAQLTISISSLFLSIHCQNLVVSLPQLESTEKYRCCFRGIILKGREADCPSGFSFKWKEPTAEIPSGGSYRTVRCVTRPNHS